MYCPNDETPLLLTPAGWLCTRCGETRGGPMCRRHGVMLLDFGDRAACPYCEAEAGPQSNGVFA